MIAHLEHNIFDFCPKGLLCSHIYFLHGCSSGWQARQPADPTNCTAAFAKQARNLKFGMHTLLMNTKNFKEGIFEFLILTPLFNLGERKKGVFWPFFDPYVKKDFFGL